MLFPFLKDFVYGNCWRIHRINDSLKCSNRSGILLDWHSLMIEYMASNREIIIQIPVTAAIKFSAYFLMTISGFPIRLLTLSSLFQIELQQENLILNITLKRWNFLSTTILFLSFKLLIGMLNWKSMGLVSNQQLDLSNTTKCLS